MTTRPKAVKVSNVTTRSQTRTKNTTNFLTTPNPIGFYLENADKRNLRLLSKESNQAFFDNLKCADAQELQEELQAMRNEPEPCKNTAKVIYNPKKGMQRAIMCAIMSTGQLHVYVKTRDLKPFLASQIVKCFDKNYELKLTLLYPTEEGPPAKPTLYCRDGFHALRLHCVDAQELEEMRQSTSLECKNFSTRMWYNPEENMQHAIMCAIISVDQTLHMYVNREHLVKFRSLYESLQCFLRNYRLDLTLLCDEVPMSQQVHGLRVLKGALASDGRLEDQRGVQVVRFTGNTHVAERAFEGNESLMELLDMNGIQEIHDGAFTNCNALQEVGDMPALRRIGNFAFYETQLTQLGNLSSLTTIGDSAFFHAPLTQLVDMSALTTIGNFAFYETQLTQLGNLSSLTKIGKGAFHTTLLEQLGKMPALTRIEDAAFYQTKLREVGDMKSLESIGNYAFEDTPLEKLGDMQSLEEIGALAFQGTKLTQLGDMPKLTFIGGSAFYGTPLKQLGDMKNLTFIGGSAFYGTPLAQLGDLSSLKTIGDYAFHSTQLTQLVDMPSLTTIDEGAFANCRNLSVVRLPKTLKHVLKNAFEDDHNLREVTVEPGANFVCKCYHLAEFLEETTDDVRVEREGPGTYRIQAVEDILF